MTGLYIVRYTIKCNAVYQYFDDDFNNVASDVSCDEVALCIATYILLNVDILTQCSIGHYWYPNSCAKNDRFQNLTSHYVYDQKLRSKKSNVTIYAGTIYVLSFPTAEIKCDVNYFLDSFVWEVGVLYA